MDYDCVYDDYSACYCLNLASHCTMIDQYGISILMIIAPDRLFSASGSGALDCRNSCDFPLMSPGRSGDNDFEFLKLLFRDLKT